MTDLAPIVQKTAEQLYTENLASLRGIPTWDQLQTHVQHQYMEQMLPVISTAAPYIIAQVEEELATQRLLQAIAIAGEPMNEQLYNRLKQMIRDEYTSEASDQQIRDISARIVQIVEQTDFIHISEAKEL